MKGQEIIENIIRYEMPDTEQVRKNCHAQAGQKTVINRTVWAVRTVAVCACTILVVYTVLFKVNFNKTPVTDDAPVLVQSTTVTADNSVPMQTTGNTTTLINTEPMQTTENTTSLINTEALQTSVYTGSNTESLQTTVTAVTGSAPLRTTVTAVSNTVPVQTTTVPLQTTGISVRPEQTTENTTFYSQVTITRPADYVPKNTPNRVGKGTVLPCLERGYTLEEAIAESDLIVDLTIFEWLGEDDRNTYFTAQINTTYKGYEYDEIKLKQDGNSKFTVKQYPLFQNNDRLLLFLEKYEDYYWIIGAFSTVLDVKEYNGQLCLIDKFSFMTDNINSSITFNSELTEQDLERYVELMINPDDNMLIYFNSLSMQEKKEYIESAIGYENFLRYLFFSELYKDDPILSKYNFKYSNIFTYEEIINGFF